MLNGFYKIKIVIRYRITAQKSNDYGRRKTCRLQTELTKRHANKKMPKISAKRICLIRTSALGDTVHALALVNGLRHGFPDAHITWVLQNIPHEMVKYQPVVNKFITFNRKGGIREWRNLVSRLRREAFDLALTPQTSAKASLITLFTKAEIKLGFDRRRSRELHWLVTNRRIPPRPMGHAQDMMLEFLEALGINDYIPRWDFIFTQEERAWQEEFFSRFDRPVLGLVIASAHPEKDWPPDRYAAVCDHACARLGLSPLLIGGPSRKEADIAESIVRLCRHKPVVALEKPIRHTMLQLDGCRMVIAPDTGPLHIAVALGVPTIGLYGYSDPRRCGPYRRFSDLLLDKYNNGKEPAGPITRRTKPGRMLLISPGEVIEKIEYALEHYPKRNSSRPETEQSL